MPTEEERRRKEYRNGYDPRGPLPGKWDAARAEINTLQGGASDFGSAAQVARGVDATKGFFKDAFSRESFTLAPADKERRLAQARMGIYPSADESFNPPRVEQPAAAAPPPQPLMAEAAQPSAQQPLTKRQTDYPPDAVANGSAPAGTRQTTGGAMGVAARGGQVPRSPHDQKVFDSQQNDALGRYREMANWSLEQRNAYLDSLPEGQRPIQTIRGNTEGWYNPSLSKEFSGLPQALTGVEGRPTLQSENMREQEARDRVSHEGIAGARNATAMAMEDKRQTGANARHADGSKGGKSTEWKEFVQKGQDANGNPTEETVVWNPAAGPHTIISPRKTPAKAIASAIIGDFQNEKARDGWLPLFERLDADKVSEIASAMPPEVKEHYRKSLIDKIKESEKDKKAKGK